MGTLATAIDWDTCKLQYEVFGDSMFRIAATHNIPLDTLEYVAREENWQEATSAPKPAQVASALKQYESRIAAAILYREVELFPLVARVENILLAKIHQSAGLIDPATREAPTQLAHLGRALSYISEKQSVLKDRVSQLLAQSGTQDIAISMNFGDSHGE